MDTQQQIDDLKHRMTTLEIAVVENTELTATVKADTKELVDAFKSAQGAWKFFGFLSNVAKPVMWLVGLGAAVMHFWDTILVALKGIK